MPGGSSFNSWANRQQRQQVQHQQRWHQDQRQQHQRWQQQLQRDQLRALQLQRQRRLRRAQAADDGPWPVDGGSSSLPHGATRPRRRLRLWWWFVGIVPGAAFISFMAAQDKVEPWLEQMRTWLASR
jgi:hypothetical protein